MSYLDSDMYDEDHYDEWIAELYAEHSEQAIGEFILERLRSYYVENPLLAEAPYSSLKESRNLISNHPVASLVFAASAIEVGLKTVLLKPIVFGLVHSESIANLISDLTLAHTGIERYRNLLFNILSDHGSINLNEYVREGSSITVWEEICNIQKKRNVVLHKSKLENVTKDDAIQSISVASVVLEEMFTKIMDNLGLHLHEGIKICNKTPCKLK